MVVRRRATMAAAGVLALGLAATGCGDAGNGPPLKTADGRVHHLNMGSFGAGSAPQENFNPYSPSSSMGGGGTPNYFYEPLFVVDKVGCEETPWLATDYTWGEGNRTLSFTMRDGVEWNDGKPLTARDVVFTFELKKKYPALDPTGLWQHLSGVEARGSEVVFTFKNPSRAWFPSVLDVGILPEHVWGEVKDPVTYTNPEPVGTGPYRVKSFNTQKMVLERNPGYWQADRIQVQELWFNRAPRGSSVNALRLARGEFDTNAMFVPDIDRVYVDQDPEHNHYWFPGGSNISLSMNTARKPFDDVRFRRALSYAVDREAIVEKAQYGYVKPASQTGVVLPGNKDWLAGGLKDDGRLPYDVERAARMLDEAGYGRPGGKGPRLGRDGKPLKLSLKVEAGYTDWIQAAQLLRESVAPLGIDVVVETPAVQTLKRDKELGQFDMGIDVFGGGCDRYAVFDGFLSSAKTAPLGEKSGPNVSRWKDEETDRLLQEVRDAPDEAAAQEAFEGLQRVMTEKVPTIPLWYGANWFQYRTEKVTGWPSAKNPYAHPGDKLLILTRLRPAD